MPVPTLLPSAWLTTPTCACGLPHPNPTPDDALPNITMLYEGCLRLCLEALLKNTPTLYVIYSINDYYQ